MSRLGIVVSHPIQYFSPLYRYLAQHIDVVVFYGIEPTAEQVGADGFGAAVDWGTDLMDGYEYRVLSNVARAPATSGFFNVDVPGIGKALADAAVTHVLIMGWQFKYYWQAFRYCLQRAMPVAVRGDSQINSTEASWKTHVRTLSHPRFLKRYTCALYVGSRNKAYLLRYGVDPSRLLHAPHAVDQQFWKPVERRRSVDDGLVRIVWVGKFIEKKHPLDAILAFRAAVAADPGLRLTMVGLGELREECKRMASGDPRISFPGFKNQRELRDVYADSDCLLLTSDYRETWGLVVNEAMAIGLPAIVSDRCGSAEDMVRPGSSGYTYRFGNIDDLVDRVRRMALQLRQNPAAFRPGVEAVSRLHSFETNLTALRTFMDGDTRPHHFAMLR